MRDLCGTKGAKSSLLPTDSHKLPMDLCLEFSCPQWGRQSMAVTQLVQCKSERSTG